MLRRLTQLSLHWQILIALILAIMAGAAAGETGAIGPVRFVDAFSFVGDLFLRALKMLVVPLIVSAIITGVSSIGADHAFGRLGLKTVVYYLSTSLMAILVGLALVNWVSPGISGGKPIEVGLKASPEQVQERVGDRGAGDVVDIFRRMIPENVVDSASNNSDMLALIFFSILFGYFMSRVEGKAADLLRNFWQGVYDVMIRITGLVMRFAPIGVFGLVASVVATTDFRALAHLVVFFFTVLAALAIHLFITLPLLLRFLGRVKPARHYRAMLPAMLTAFSTSSSSATLPVTIECVEERAKVPRRISSFVLPLGATVNMDGTALYECVAAMFIAQVYGLELTFGVQFITVMLALFTSIGVAGVPQASLVAIVVILGAINLPAEGIALLMLFDRLLDMCRTVVNIFSDSCGAVIIARSEGETGVLT